MTTDHSHQTPYFTRIPWALTGVLAGEEGRPCYEPALIQVAEWFLTKLLGSFLIRPALQGITAR